MTSPLLKFIAESENACCPFGYILLHADLTIRKHARTIGVAKETLRLWRKDVALGNYQCVKGEHCLCTSKVIDPEAVPEKWKGTS
jgi:hypothetical protein